MEEPDTDGPADPDGAGESPDTVETVDATNGTGGPASEDREKAPGTTGESEESGPPVGTGEDARGESPEPTPQSAAVRRQQRSVGVAGTLLAGVALATATLQRFPDRPALAAVAGVAGAALVLLLVRRSIVPGERTDTE